VSFGLILGWDLGDERFLRAFAYRLCRLVRRRERRWRGGQIIGDLSPACRNAIQISA